jgi:hypothetical protein
MKAELITIKVLTTTADDLKLLAAVSKKKQYEVVETLVLREKARKKLK